MDFNMPTSPPIDSAFALQFQNLSVISRGSKRILHKVSGFVKRGGLTAVLGASAAGKSVLLQSLSGRIQDLPIEGEILIDGCRVNPKLVGNPVVYVPQEDVLVGELTPREMTMNTALLTRAEPKAKLRADTNEILQRLMISNVADSAIGTLLLRGISGGQKRRTSLATFLISHPSVLFVDELTSGLDETIAFEVLSTVRALANTGAISIMLTIHQPNVRMLELFDHILILKNGSSLFFGTVPESVQYFENLGFACPLQVTATDYFLQISSDAFAESANGFDFVKAFNLSSHRGKYNKILEETAKTTDSSASLLQGPRKEVSRLSQIRTLLYRDFTLAYRDPTLYHLQIFLASNFCLVAGMVFFDLPRNVGTDFFAISCGISWIVCIVSWCAVFKVYHINHNDKRARHELANNLYTPFVYFAVDSLSTAILSVAFLPPVLITFFMMNFPIQALPFLLFDMWVVGIKYSYLFDV